jgi:hypothetical protein
VVATVGGRYGEHKVPYCSSEWNCSSLKTIYVTGLNFPVRLQLQSVLECVKNIKKKKNMRGPTQKKRDCACKSFYLTNSGNQLRSPSK